MTRVTIRPPAKADTFWAWALVIFVVGTVARYALTVAVAGVVLVIIGASIIAIANGPGRGSRWPFPWPYHPRR